MEYLLAVPERYAPELLRESLDFFNVKYPANATKSRLCKLYNQHIKPKQEDPQGLRQLLSDVDADGSNFGESSLLISRSTNTSEISDTSAIDDDIPPFIQNLSDEILLACIQKLERRAPSAITESNRRACERLYKDLLEYNLEAIENDLDILEPQETLMYSDDTHVEHLRQRTNVREPLIQGDTHQERYNFKHREKQRNASTSSSSLPNPFKRRQQLNTVQRFLLLTAATTAVAVAIFLAVTMS